MARLLPCRFGFLLDPSGSKSKPCGEYTLTFSKDVETVFGPVLASITEELGGWILGEMFPGTEALQASVSPGCGRAWAYLAMFGVDPKLQGQGIGSAFLQHERKRITGPIGLSTQTEKNVSSHTTESGGGRHRLMADPVL